MTNLEAKQEAIKKAWGNNYDLVKNYLEANGLFINNDNLSYLTIGLDFSKIEMEWVGNYYRPISIKGVSDNNGWVRIEESGNNLPKSGDFRVYNNNPDIIFASSNDIFDYDDVSEMFEDGSITHYKPITPEKPPLY